MRSGGASVAPGRDLYSQKGEQMVIVFVIETTFADSDMPWKVASSKKSRKCLVLWCYCCLLPMQQLVLLFIHQNRSVEEITYQETTVGRQSGQRCRQ